MLCYCYDRTTGEYIETINAMESPLEPGVYLRPAHSTQTEPPAAQPGKARVFREGVWSFVPDHRGETWFDGYGQPQTVETIGKPADLVQTPPPALPAGYAFAGLDADNSYILKRAQNDG